MPRPARESDAGADVVLRPPVSSRLLLNLGVVGFSFGIIWLTNLASANQVLVAVLCVIAVMYVLWLAVRIWFIRVELHADILLAVGWFGSRRIARSSAQRLTSASTPILVWLDESGKKRFTIISGLHQTSSVVPFLGHSAARNRKLVIDWIDDGRLSAD